MITWHKSILAMLFIMVSMMFSSAAFAVAGNADITPLPPLSTGATVVLTSPVPQVYSAANPQSRATGSISGIVYDMNDKAVAGARVSLYSTAYINGKYKNQELLNIENNPQYSSDGHNTADGAFYFTRIPKGTYNLTVEKDGKISGKLINIDGDLVTTNILLIGYFNPADPTIMPTVAPSIGPVDNDNDDQSANSVIRIFFVIMVIGQFTLSLVILLLHFVRRV